MILFAPPPRPTWARFLRLGPLLLALAPALLAQPAPNDPGIIRNGPLPKPARSLPTLVDFDLGPTPSPLLLPDYFEVPAASGEYAALTTPYGTLYLEFLTADAPATVANFRDYLATDSTAPADLEKTYDNTFFHRRFALAEDKVILQGGGYRAIDGQPALAARPPVANEFKVANTRGTVALAKVSGQPDSGTNQWFINLDDNSTILGSANNGGFTVFARVLGDGVAIAERIASLPIYNLGGAFTHLPLRDVRAGQARLEIRNLVPLTRLRAVPASSVPAAFLAPRPTFSILSNSNPAALAATLARDGTLTLRSTPRSGRAELLLRAELASGHHHDHLLVTTRSGPPALTARPPATSTQPLGTRATLSAQITAWPAPSIQWQRQTADGTWTPLASDDPLFSGIDTSTLRIALDSTPHAAAALALSGARFRYVATNPVGTLTSPPTTLRITTLPVGFSEQPVKLLPAALGTEPTLTVTALPGTGNTPLTYRWQRLPPGAHPRNGWVDLAESSSEAPTRHRGVATRSLRISLTGEDESALLEALALNDSHYRCIIGNLVGTATSAPARLRVLTTEFTLATPGERSLPGLTAAPGRVFSARGLPAGLVLDPATGLLTGLPTARPGTYLVTVTIREPGAPPGTRGYYLLISPLTGKIIGGFEALLTPGDGDAPPLAKVSLLITETGAFTGTLSTTEDPRPLPLRGQTRRDPTDGSLSFSAPLLVPRAGAPAGRAYLLTDLGIDTTGRLALTLSSRVTPSVEPTPIARGTEGRRLATYDRNRPAPWATVAAYHLAFTSPAPLAPPAEGEPSPELPRGSGLARAPIDPTGRLLITGKLPDGAPLTASLPPGEDASYRLLARPYGSVPGGMVSAEFKLSSTRVRNGSGSFFDRYALGADGGEDTYWIRPGGLAKPAGYTPGFGPLGLTLRVQPWIFFNGTNLGLKFTPDGDSATLGLVFDGPTLDSLPSAPPGILAINFTTFRLASSTPPDPLRVDFKLVEATGALTGSLLLPDGRKVTLEGLFLVPAIADYRNPLPPGTITAEGMATIPASAGSTLGPRTERFKLRQPDPAPQGVSGE